MIAKKLEGLITDLKSKNLYRRRELIFNTKNELNFSSNDYLSLAECPYIKNAFQEGFKRYPSGSRGSLVVSGYHSVHQALEEAFKVALKVDDALLFTSGYAANLAVFSLIQTLKLHPILDKAIHASCYDGVRLNNLTFSRFIHNNYLDLQKKINQTDKPSVILTEGIFSQTGQRAPLKQYGSIGEIMNSSMIVDEAHSFGVLGAHGLGATYDANLTQLEVPLRIIPFGKSFATQGAVVVGQGQWIEALLQSARTFIYSTGISPALTYGILQAFNFMQKADNRRKRLFDLIHYFQQKITGSPFNWTVSDTPIQQLKLGSAHLALSYSEALKKSGIFCVAMREPTVPRQDTGLRVVLNYQHQEEDIDRLFQNLLAIYESQL